MSLRLIYLFILFLFCSLCWDHCYLLKILWRIINQSLCVNHPTDLEWKLIYVGSAEDETYDQLLESVLVGPVNVGNYRFVFQVNLVI